MSARLSALDRVTVDDQWPEILERATGIGVVDLVVAERPQPHGPRLALAFAAGITALMLIGGGFVLGRSTSGTRVATTAPVLRWAAVLSVSVPAPDRTGVPLVSGAAGMISAAYRGGRDVVLADETGANRSVAVPGEIAALHSGTDRAGSPITVVITRGGAVVRIGARGDARTVAQIGPVPSELEIAVAAGRIFVSGTGKPLLAIDADGGVAPKTVGTITATLVSSWGNVVWAIDAASGDTERVDASSLRISGTTRVRDVVAISADADGAYLARPASGQVSVVDEHLALRPVSSLDQQSNSISAGDAMIWSSAFGVVRGNDARSGQLVSTIALPTTQIALAYDGRSTWAFGDHDGLHRLERVG